jgi:hypothetical protein
VSRVLGKLGLKTRAEAAAARVRWKGAPDSPRTEAPTLGS